MPATRVIPPHPTDANSRHDDRYYTETESDDALALKANTSDMTSALAEKAEQADMVTAQAQIAYTNPGSAGTAGQSYARSPLTNLPKWFPRRYIVVDEYLSDGGTIQDALNAVPASGADVVFRADGSSYTVPNAGLTVKSKTRIVPMGSRAAVLQAPASATGNAVVRETNFARNITIEGLELDCNNHATMKRGFSSEYNDSTYRDLRLIDLVVRNALDHGIFTWRSNGVTIERPQIYNCGYGIYASAPEGPVLIVRPYIVNTVAGRMLFGIRANSGAAGSALEIQHPYISGADYASPFGAEAHGISISGPEDWKIIGGWITLCGNPANRRGGGLVVAESHRGSCVGLTSSGNYATGIWSELEPAGDTTLGTAGQIRGAQFTNIHVNENGSAGMSGSYGAGTVMTNIEAAMNGVEGIVWDSDGIILTGFRVYNNWQDSGAAAPLQNGGAKAGIRVYVGQKSVIANGYTYDNQAVKTQQYGIAAHLDGHIISNVVAYGNGTGPYTSTGGGSTKNKITSFDGYVSRNSGVTSVADGGTISHGLATTPTAYGATCTTADEYVAITAVSSTTLTVALTKHDGTPGTTANVAWWAEV